MILLEFGLWLPKIKRYKHNGNVTIVFNFGIFKLTWMNRKLSDIFLTVSGMAIRDLESVLNHSIIIEGLKNDYEFKIGQLEKLNDDLLDDNGMLKDSIKDLTKQLNDLNAVKPVKKSRKKKVE